MNELAPPKIVLECKVDQISSQVPSSFENLFSSCVYFVQAFVATSCVIGSGYVTSQITLCKLPY